MLNHSVYKNTPSKLTKEQEAAWQKYYRDFDAYQKAQLVVTEKALLTAPAAPPQAPPAAPALTQPTVTVAKV